MAEKESIANLIGLVDCHERILFKGNDIVEGSLSNTFRLLIIILVAIEAIVITETFLHNFTYSDIIIITLALLAAFFAFFSFMTQVGERNIVEVRYKRALRLKQFTDEEKLFLKALIKLRTRNPDTELEKMYILYPNLFEKERLLDLLYEKLFG